MGALLPTLTPDLIVTTFANAGNKTAPPQTDPNGFVNYHDGYGPDYEIDLTSGNTSAKGVERPVQNYLFAQMTSMMQWWQSMGISPWYSTMANQGTSGYNAGALVGRVNSTSNEWVIWRSLVDANTTDPNTNGQTSWDYVPITSDLSTMFAMPAGGQGQKLLPGGITTEQILAAKDFNTLTTGTFEYVTDSIATGSSNTPSNYAGLVECKLWSNAGVTFGVQRYLDRTGAIWTRGMQNGTWTTWATFAVTHAAVIAALGYTPANQAITITAGTGLSGGGDLSANRTISLGPIAQSAILANPTAGSAVPVACTLLNGITLNSPANTLGLGTITPANVASQGYVNGTTASFTGSGSFVGIANSGNETLNGQLSISPTSALPSTAGSYNVPFIFSQSDGSNADNLVIQHNRNSTGSDWTTTSMQIYRKVDSTVQGFIQFGEQTGGSGLAFGSGSTEYLSMTGAGAWYFSSRPSFNGATPWDTANFNPSNYLPLTGGTLSGNLSIANSGTPEIEMKSTGAGGHDWFLISVGPSWGGGLAAGCFAFFDNTSGGTRAYFDPSGNFVTNNTITVNTSGTSNSISMTDTSSSGPNLRFNGPGTTTPNKTIRVTGGNLEFINNAYTLVITYMRDDGSWVMSGSITCTTFNATSSDETLKKNFVAHEPRSMHQAWYGEYDRIDVDYHGRGLVAQNIQKFMPEHVHENKETKKLAVDMTGVALEQSIWCGRRIDELLEQMDELQKRIAILEGRQ